MLVQCALHGEVGAELALAGLGDRRHLLDGLDIGHGLFDVHVAHIVAQVEGGLVHIGGDVIALHGHTAVEQVEEHIVQFGALIMHAQTAADVGQRKVVVDHLLHGQAHAEIDVGRHFDHAHRDRIGGCRRGRGRGPGAHQLVQVELVGDQIEGSHERAVLQPPLQVVVHPPLGLDAAAAERSIEADQFQEFRTEVEMQFADTDRRHGIAGVAHALQDELAIGRELFVALGLHVAHTALHAHIRVQSALEVLFHGHHLLHAGQVELGLQFRVHIGIADRRGEVHAGLDRVAGHGEREPFEIDHHAVHIRTTRAVHLQVHEDVLHSGRQVGVLEAAVVHVHHHTKARHVGVVVDAFHEAAEGRFAAHFHPAEVGREFGRHQGQQGGEVGLPGIPSEVHIDVIGGHGQPTIKAKHQLVDHGLVVLEGELHVGHVHVQIGLDIRFDVLEVADTVEHHVGGIGLGGGSQREQVLGEVATALMVEALEVHVVGQRCIVIDEGAVLDPVLAQADVER